MTRSVGSDWRVRLAAVLLAASLCASLLPGVALANWTPDGVLVYAGTTSQIFPVVCPDLTGGAIVVWRDYSFPSQPYDQLYAQRLDAAGVPQWGPDGVRVAASTGDQRVPSILAMPGGGAMIAWEEDRNGNWDIYAQRLTAAGTVAAGWPANGLRVSPYPNHELDPFLITDSYDGGIIVWDMIYSTTDWDIRAAHVLGNGVVDTSWPNGGIAQVTGALTLASYPCAVTDDAGGFYVAWQDSNAMSAQADVYASHLNATGQPIFGWGPNGNAICAAPGWQGHPRLVRDDAAGAIAVWRDARYDPDGDIWATRLGEFGAELWGAGGIPVCIADYVQGDNWRVAAAPDVHGGAVFAWPDERDRFGTSYDVYAQRVDAAGNRLWDSTGVRLCDAPGVQYRVALCSDGLGGALAVWEDQRAGADIYGQHVTLDGQRAWPRAGLPFCAAAGSQRWPEVIDNGVWGAIAVWDDFRSGTSTDVYAGQLDGFSNLVAVNTPPGWDAPAVPRNQTGAGPGDVHVTPALDGNSNSTWLNYQTDLYGPNPVPEFYTDCLVDDSFGYVTVFPEGSLPQWWMGYDVGPLEVRGGRHTVSLFADSWGVVPESEAGEFDNFWQGQWVWSPLPLARNTPQQRALPPEWGNLSYPNSDGMGFARPYLANAWLVSAAPRAFNDDYDLYVYDDYGGSTAGFSNFIGGSRYGLNYTDFVVGHYTTAPATVYPAVVCYNRAGGGYNYFANATDAWGRESSVMPSRWEHVVMPTGQAADVYEAYLAGGTQYYFTAIREAGESDLEVSVFPATGGGIWGRGGAAAVSAPTGPAVVQAVYTPSVSGWYPVVVCQSTGDYVVYGVNYTLIWDTQPSTDVPDTPPETFELAFRGASPNPMRDATQIEFTLSRPGPVRLEIFDLRGRRLRQLTDASLEAGRHVVGWNGCTDAGASVPTGMCWAKLTAEGQEIVRRIAVVR
jgi:hypothetical protein